MKSARRVLTLLLIGSVGIAWLGGSSFTPEKVADGPPDNRPAASNGSGKEGRDPNQGGDKAILERAIVGLERLRSLSATTRQRVDLLGVKLVGTGQYFEQHTAEGLDLRLELKLQGEQASSFLQVCHGQYLWICRDKEPPVRIDVHRVNRALKEQGEVFESGRIGDWPGLGGLPKMLRGLHACFDFASIEETQLGEQLPVYRLRGEWRPEKRAKVLGGKAGGKAGAKPANWDSFPQHLPHYVVLYLEKSGLFPRRLECRRYAPRGSDGRPVKEDPILVSMDLYEVVLNAPIAPGWFLFDSKDLEPADRTDWFLERAGLKTRRTDQP